MKSSLKSGDFFLFPVKNGSFLAKRFDVFRSSTHIVPILSSGNAIFLHKKGRFAIEMVIKMQKELFDFLLSTGFPTGKTRENGENMKKTHIAGPW